MFLLEPTDAAYRSWWPGEHDRVGMKALVGRRLTFAGAVAEVGGDRRVAWQRVCHTVQAGLGAVTSEERSR